MYPNDDYFSKELDSLKLNGSEIEEIDEMEMAEMEQMLNPYMQQYVVQAPSQSETDALLTQLRPQFQRRLGDGDEKIFNHRVLSEDPFSSLQSKQNSQYSFMRLMSLQYHIYSKAFLYIALGMIACITILASSRIQIVKGEQLLSFSIPLLVIASVIYGFRSSQNKLSHLQEISPYPPVLQFIARVFLVSSICLVLGLLSSLVILLSQDQFHSFTFIWSWVAPTALLSGQLVYVMQKRGIVPGIVSSVVVWLCYMLLTHSSWVTYIPFLSKSLGIIAFLIGAVLLAVTIFKLIHHPVVRSWRIDEI